VAELIHLTEGVVRITSVSDAQLPYSAVDVLRFDSLDILISAGFESPDGSQTLVLKLLSGTQRASTDGWITSSVSPEVSLKGGVVVQQASWTVSSPSAPLFRYVRWQVYGFSGATAAYFRIDAIGRKIGG